ncbi:hypothetical protein B0T16DRAFT_463289 [Cercophora newfieldiana]|uniref:3-carboxymuconate cyclase n=1 Tax=Cercophora newfieldiana TaxID=92897 RepID=A0AA40CJA9_9PEZI|nr:hypothetical protein B0T16DRAFT_463289 [Cercophora newfieldiana]
MGGRALYFITNDETNSVVALPIGADGRLSPGTVTPTGGSGSVALNADNQPATPDALVSQSALAIAGNLIFAVNAGSNTLSMLTISPSDPTRLSLIGQPVAVPGEFPNTVAASLQHGLACVGTSGARAGISCSTFSPTRGLSPMDALRPFDLGQTTPPVGPTNTVSQTFFSADGSFLFATVKGDPPTNKTGFFSAFPIQPRQAAKSTASGRQSRSPRRFSVSSIEQRSVPAGTAVLFGSQAIPGTSNVFATDAAFGAAILSVDPTTGNATTIAKGEVQGQVATCWVTISAATGTAFVTDVAKNRVVEMSLADASVLSELDLTAATGDPGLIDLRAAGGFIYALSPGNGTAPGGIAVVDVSRGSGSAAFVQRFALDGVAGRNSMGMVILD